MSIRIIKSTNNETGDVTLIKKIDDDVEVVITDPDEYAFYAAALDKIDSGDSEAGRRA